MKNITSPTWSLSSLDLAKVPQENIDKFFAQWNELDEKYV